MPQLNQIGLQAFDPVWGEFVHESAFFEILHVVSGKLDLQVSDRIYHGEPGDTLVMPTRTLHMDVFDPEEGLQIFFVSIKWSREKEFFQYVNNETLLSMGSYRKAELVGTFDRIRGELRSGGAVNELLVRCRLLEALMLMLRAATSSGTNKETPARALRRKRLMHAAMSFLRDNYAERISLADVATALNVSGYYLSHVFSNENDFSIFEYLTSVRMEKARELLRKSDLHVSEVSHAVGYHNPNYFSKAFKKHAGCTPTEFRSAANGL